jgi:hypothetical protein
MLFPSPGAVAPISGGLLGGRELPTPPPIAPPAAALITLLTKHLNSNHSKFTTETNSHFLSLLFIQNEIISTGFDYECRFSILSLLVTVSK